MTPGDLSHVLEPITLAGTVVKNRVVRTAHQTSGVGSITTEALAAYHEEAARGGVGLTFLEVHSVHPSSGGALRAYGEGAPKHFAQLASMARRYDMRLMVQLYHGGHHARPVDEGPPWCPSEMPSISLNAPTAPMTKTMIDDLVGAFASSASLAKEAGLDGVELHVAHSYLHAQYLSPLTNTRTDEYGGSLENRLRFTMETLRAMRSAVGPDFPICLRVSATEHVEGGLTPDDAIAAIAAVEAEQLIDVVSLSVGCYAAFHTMIAPSYALPGYQLEDTAPVARTTNLPTILTGRFLTLQHADEVIARGQADMVSMVRAHIADPHLIDKTIRGIPVRPCIGCNQGCIGGTSAPPRFMVGCTVNARAGRELESGGEPTPASVAHDVLVIGGGVAGMEAARVAAARGHRVRLVEADDELGGQARLLRNVPGRRELASIVDWYVLELERLGVDVRTGCRFTADTSLDGIDVVIVATGAVPAPSFVQPARQTIGAEGADELQVVTLAELADGRAIADDTVVIVDEVGHGGGIAAVELVLAVGKRPVVVTRFSDVGSLLEPTRVPEVARARWSTRDVCVLRRAFVRGAAAGRVIVGSRDGGPDVEVRTSTVVDVTPRRPNPGLARELEGVVPRVHIVGDAKHGERWLEGSIRDGYEVAAAL